MLGGKKTEGGYNIYKVDPNSGFKEVKPGNEKGRSLAVDNDGNPWIINVYKEIYRMRNGKWQRVKGRADDIEIGPNGQVFILSPKSRGQGKIKVFRNGRWKN